MDTWDYVADETRKRPRETNILVDVDDSDEPIPNPDISHPRERALANIAVAIHKNAPALTPDQAEQVVRWMKDWKFQKMSSKRSPGQKGDYEFNQALQLLRNSPEQVDLQRRAYRYTVWGRVWGLAFAVCTAFTLGMFFADHIPWYGWLIAVVVDLVCLVMSDVALQNGAELYKEQDRRHFLAALREAESLANLLDAGLFSFIPGGYERGKPYSEMTARREVSKVRDQLADALYDDDGYLDSWLYEDNSVFAERPARV